jgi:hypothetical protein
MAHPFHPGEIEVQTRAGVREAAARLAGVVGPVLPPRAAEFLARQRIVVLGSTDAQGRVWASALAGEPGLLRAEGPHVLRIGATPAAGDPLSATGAVGVLAIDLVTRKRLRINGSAVPAPGGGLRVQVAEAYWNCPKYIQSRRLEPRPSTPGHAPEEARIAHTLSSSQRAWIEAADTFFIATAHPRAGADVSHRGGEPGFVRLARGDVIVFPDYSGNNLFNTFGNLAANPAAGLLFVDFDTGATLQLTGSAEVLWEREEFEGFPGAERAVHFRVAEARERAHGVLLHGALLTRSPFNPPAPR